MLLAEVAGDHTALYRIWQWTRSHLRLGNGLFAYRRSAQISHFGVPPGRWPPV
jgi:endo-1,4-beta-D-glucanase Y